MTDPASPASRLPLPLRLLFGHVLQAVLNRLLALDPEVASRLAALEGRQVELHLVGPELNLAIHVEQGRLRVGPGSPGSQLKISASPGSLLGLALRRLGGQGEGLTAPGKLNIAGDAELARRLEQLVSQYAPDIEEALSQRFGAVLGVPLSRALSRSLRRFRHGVKHRVEDGADWLREEARISIAPGEMDQFLDRVDLTREAVERLEVRIGRLRRSLELRHD